MDRRCFLLCGVSAAAVVGVSACDPLVRPDDTPPEGETPTVAVPKIAGLVPGLDPAPVWVSSTWVTLPDATALVAGGLFFIVAKKVDGTQKVVIINPADLSEEPVEMDFPDDANPFAGQGGKGDFRNVPLAFSGPDTLFRAAYPPTVDNIGYQWTVADGKVGDPRPTPPLPVDDPEARVSVSSGIGDVTATATSVNPHDRSTTNQQFVLANGDWAPVSAPAGVPEPARLMFSGDGTRQQLWCDKGGKRAWLYQDGHSVEVAYTPSVESDAPSGTPKTAKPSFDSGVMYGSVAVITVVVDSNFNATDDSRYTHTALVLDTNGEVAVTLQRHEWDQSTEPHLSNGLSSVGQRFSDDGRYVMIGQFLIDTTGQKAWYTSEGDVSAVSGTRVFRTGGGALEYDVPLYKASTAPIPDSNGAPIDWPHDEVGTIAPAAIINDHALVQTEEDLLAVVKVQQ